MSPSQYTVGDGRIKLLLKAVDVRFLASEHTVGDGRRKKLSKAVDVRCLAG